MKDSLPRTGAKRNIKMSNTTTNKDLATEQEWCLFMNTALLITLIFQLVMPELRGLLLVGKRILARLQQ
mgnify:CR=1 FL=1